MHELGHAHGEMGDEYISDDDRDVSFGQIEMLILQHNLILLVKWKHQLMI